jgi:small subunit ribosomal protein S6
MVIFDGSLDDQNVEATFKRITEQINQAGEIRKTDRWGRRRFAYEIDHKHEGYYVVFEVMAEGAALDHVERQLRLADDIVRHKLIRLPDREAARRGLVVQAPAAAG